MVSLVERSSIFKEKSKFFINRIVTYFTFFLTPFFLQDLTQGKFLGNMLILMVYLCFCIGQWYLLGREIDQRFKIYYRANSSMDRFLYRTVNGMIFMVLFFGLLNFLPAFIVQTTFWTFLTILGFFYSWPTRGKIVEDSMSDQFYEFRFLDSFEKTVLYLTVIMFVVSLPEIPFFQNIEALKLYFDPQEQVHAYFWNFLSVLYLPFKSNPMLFNLAWFFHIYFIGLGVFLVGSYCIFRFLVSRRLAILGAFAIASSWSFSRQLDANFMSALFSTYPIIWIWAFLWATKSSTYRSGFFVGMMNFMGTVISFQYIFLLPIQIFLGYKYFLKDKTPWYRRQWVKYTILGVILSMITALTHFEATEISDKATLLTFLTQAINIISIKAFYVLSPLGILALICYFVLGSQKYFEHFSFEKPKIIEMVSLIGAIFVVGLIFNTQMVSSFFMMWFFSFMALIPLEWIFRSISRLRSKRNIIYVMYILVCLLDSHFEGRLRIIGKLFLNDEALRYINQM